jgi:beta-glucanase (GH16 family)
MKSLFFSLCVLCSSTRTIAQCYQLVWADEFNGTALDLSKWTQITGSDGSTAPDAELQYYTSSTNNTKVENGLLKITVLNDGFGGRAYTSGRMQTKNLGDWLYGKFEARIKLPVAQGMWPAFWLLPTDNTYGVWPQSGEVDIMETVGSEATRNSATIHTSNNGTPHGFTTKYNLPTGTFADDFHVFSMEWSPNLMTFYVDGNLYATKTNATVSPYPWVFDKRFYALLNVGGFTRCDNDFSADDGGRLCAGLSKTSRHRRHGQNLGRNKYARRFLRGSVGCGHDLSMVGDERNARFGTRFGANNGQLGSYEWHCFGCDERWLYAFGNRLDARHRYAESLG